MTAAVLLSILASAAAEPAGELDLLGVLNTALVAQKVCGKSDRLRAADALAHKPTGTTATPLVSRGAATTPAEPIAASANPQIVLPNIIISPNIYNPAEADAAAARAWAEAPRLESGEVAALDYLYARISDEIAACYEWPLGNRERQRETVTTSVLVSPAGKVTAARVLRRAGESISTMEPCMRDALLSLRFPANLRGVPVEVRYPWTFVRPAAP